MNRRTTWYAYLLFLAGAASLLQPLPAISQGAAAEAGVGAEVDEDDDFLGDDDDLFGDDGEDLFERADRPEAEAPGQDDPDAVETDPDLEPIVDSPRGRTGPSAGVEEILITGDRVEGAVIDTNTSAVSFNSDDLEAMGIEDVSDLAAFTPNLEIVSPGSTTATFFIRGVGLSDFSANAAGAVAIYQDDVALNSPPLQVAQIFDVENIAVERGPQGSGPGRNASGGAIKIYSRKPSMGEHAARLRVSLGKFESDDIHDAMTQDYEGSLNMALLDDVLAARVAFRFTESDPFFTNRCSAAPPISERTQGQRICGERVVGPPGPGSFGDRRIKAGLPRHIGDEEVWAVRGALRFQPPDSDMDWTLNFHGSRRNEDGNIGQAIGTGQSASGGVVFGGRTQSGYQEPDSIRERERLVAKGKFTPTEINAIRGRRQAQNRPLDIHPFTGDFDRTGHNRLDIFGTFLRGEFGFDSWQLRSTSAFDTFKRDTKGDTDYTPNVLFETAQDNDLWQFFQELEASGELDALPFSWSTGGYFLYEDLQVESNIDISTALFNVEREYEQNLTSFGVHAGFEWTLLDDFTLEAGARYNYSHKSFNITQRQPNIPILSPSKGQRDKTWDHISGTVSLTYAFSDDASAYAKFNHGWKAGHFNTNGLEQTSTSSTPKDAASPEKINAVEFGVHADFFDGRAKLTTAAFFYNYEDYQVFIFEDNPNQPPSLEIINANDAQLFGIEADVTLRPLEATFDFIPEEIQGLEIKLLFAWLDSQFLDFQNTQFVDGGAGGTIPILVDYSGNQLLNAPNLNLSGYIQWPLDFGRYGQLIPRWDFTWKDDVFFDPSQGRGSTRFDGSVPPDFAVGQPAYWLHNVRLGWRSADGRLGVAGWCRNVLDHRYKNYAFDASRFEGVVINFLGDPRSCGAEFSFTW